MKFNSFLFCTLLVLLSFTIKTSVSAQKLAPSLKHVQGISSLGIGGGYVQDGFNLGLGYSYYMKSRLLLRCKGIFESTKINSTGLTFIYLNPEIMYSFIKVGNSLYFNLKGGPIVGYESLKNTLLNSKKNALVYGGEIGLNTEIFLSSKISLNIDYDQRLIAKSNAGSQSYTVMLGLVYFF